MFHKKGTFFGLFLHHLTASSPSRAFTPSSAVTLFTSSSAVPVPTRGLIPTTFLSMSTSTTNTNTSTNNVGGIGSKLTDMELAKEALSLFYDDITNIELQPTTGGVNNIVQYVHLPNGERELLRIYNNGCDERRVLFEHAILKQLNTIPHLTFQVPQFLPSSKDATKTMVRLSNGADACLCKIIPGHLPKLTCARDLGRAAGELNTALTKIDVVDPSMCNVAPYWKIYEVHPAVTRENFEQTMKDHYFDHVRPVADRMLKEVLYIDDLCSTTYRSLPVQLIHGDLHYDNVLVEDGKVTALLDFEFSSFDWRALEIAIGLSKYAGEEPHAMPYFEEYISGYATTGILTKEEAQAVPDLINLRILSNIVYFVGRHIAGQDNISSITTRIENYARRVDWVKDHKDEIVQMIVDKMNLE